MTKHSDDTVDFRMLLGWIVLLLIPFIKLARSDVDQSSYALLDGGFTIGVTRELWD